MSTKRKHSRQGQSASMRLFFRKEDAWLRPLFAQHKGLSLIGIILGVIAVLFAGALMFTSGYMISLAAILPLTVLALHLPSIFVRIFGIGKPLIDYVQRLATHDWVLRATSSLRRRLYVVLERAQSSVIEMKRQGEVLSYLVEDIEHVQNLCIRSIFPYLIAIIVYLVVAIALGIFNVAVGLFALVMLGVVLLGIPFAYLASMRAQASQMQRMRTQMHVRALEDVRGLADWVLAGRESGFLKGFRESQRRFMETRALLERAQRRRAVLIQAVMALTICGVFLFAAYAFGEQIPALQNASVRALSEVQAIDATAASVTWIAAFVLCAFPVLEVLAHAPEQALDALSHEDAIRELNALEHEIADKPQSASEGSAYPKEHDPRSSVQGHEHPASWDVRLDHVSFTYPEASRPLFEDFSLHIPFPSRVAVIGPSGCGKSTLARLIYGELSPDAGSTMVGGEDPAKCSEPYRVMSTLYQNAYLFDTTLRENLLVANGHADDAELISALERVGLADLCANGGLDRRLGEGGAHLSGGQRQRVALARMLLTDTPIVVLDEPYLWVDVDTEQMLSELIEEVMGDRTVILITHTDIDEKHYDHVVRL